VGFSRIAAVAAGNDHTLVVKSDHTRLGPERLRAARALPVAGLGRSRTCVMTPISYCTGQDIRTGDLITYHGESGHVQFVIADPPRDPSQAWYLDQFPRGGVMIEAERFGSVFIRLEDIDEQLQFIARVK
jgi:hypothetical protein